MPASEERLQILKMIEDGTISAEEAVRLLGAVDESTTQHAASATTKPRWFRVRVTDMHTGKSKLNVNIPFGLVSVGMRMGARFAPDVADVDLAELLHKIENEEARGKVLDIEDPEDGEHVEIFVE